MKIIDIKNYEDLETYFNKRRKIRFHNNVKIESKKDIIDKIYSGFSSKATYYVKGGKHCEQCRSRSIVDILLLMKYYFPDSKLIDNFKSIIEYSENTSYGIYCIYCPNIRKDNFHGLVNYSNYNYGYINRCFHEKEYIDLFVNLKVDMELNVIK